jgi:phage shock protein PspC (stress-responsive transcriptional regulator)
MRKTVNISIGSSLFVIEEAAYARLEAYLKSIRAHFAATADDAEEIVSDIEDRIAEELDEKLSARKKVVSMEDVDEVIRRMGTVKDFEQFDDSHKEGEWSSFKSHFSKIRLYRDSDDKIIAGVCAGIAKYFNIDPIIIRLAFGLSLFMGGFGFVLYILLWIILPEAKTTAEKVEMTGGRVTLSAIQSRIEKAIPSEKRRGAIRKVLAFPFALIRGVFEVIGRVLRFVLPLIARVAGFLLTIWAAFAIAFASFVLLAMLVNPASPYIGFPLREALGAIPYMIVLFSVYFLALVPLIFVILAGTSLLTLRNVFSVGAVVSLSVLWFVTLTALGVTASTVAPHAQTVAQQYEEEHWQLTEKELNLRGFTAVTPTDHVGAKITKGPQFSVKVRAPKNYLDSIQGSVAGNKLSLTRKMPEDTSCILFCPHREAMVEITMPTLTALEVDNHSMASLSGFTEDINYVATDHSFIAGDVTAKNAIIDLRGHSTTELSGTVTTMTLKVKDHSSAELGEFAATDVAVEMMGQTNARVHATGKLSGTVTDNSFLFYEGSPTTFEVTTSGHSDVRGEDREEGEGW